MKKRSLLFFFLFMLINTMFTKSSYFVYELWLLWYYQLGFTVLIALSIPLLKRFIYWIMEKFLGAFPSRYFGIPVTFAMVVLYCVVLGYTLSFLNINFYTALHVAFMSSILFWFADMIKRYENAANDSGIATNHIGDSLNRSY